MKYLRLLKLSFLIILLFGTSNLWSQVNIVGNPYGGNPYPTIQSAVLACSGGETINVDAGIYNEQVVIAVPLTLLGAQANIDPRPSEGGRSGAESIIDVQELGSYVIRISADNVEINGFTVTGGTGDMVEESGAANNMLFRYNIIYDDLGTSGDEGIQIKYSDGVIMEYNYVYHTIGDGLNLSESTNGFIRFNEAHDIQSGDAAIYCYEATNINIIGNKIYNIPNNDGIKLGDENDGSTGGSVNDNDVSNCAQDGINIYASQVTVDNNTIYDCYSENGAIYISKADNATVTNNLIHDNAAIGVLVYGTVGVDINNNEIYNNDDSDDTKYTGSAGIWLANSSSITTTNIIVNSNCIYDNFDYGAKNETGTVFDATNNWWGDPTGPFHSTNPTGVGNQVSDDVTFNPWSATNLCGSAPIVIDIETPTSVSCGVYDIDITVQNFDNVGAISLDLTFDQFLIGNPTITNLTTGLTTNFPNAGQLRVGYWGNPLTLADDAILFTLHFDLLPSQSGGPPSNLTWSRVPGECELAGPNGDPIYTSTFNDLAWTIPVRPVKNINTGYEYCKIQPAVVDPLTLDNHTITVAAGIYEEQVTVDGKILTIIGAGNTQTFVNPPVNMAVSFTTSYDAYAVVTAINDADLTWQKMTVDGLGRGNANYKMMGIAFRNSGGEVDDCKILNIENTPFSGAQHGVSVYAYNDDGTTRNLDVTDNIITNFQKNAMALNAGATTGLVLDVSGNEITGHGATTVTAQNGIQTWGELITGDVTDNKITGIAYDNTSNPTKWVATSILNFYSNIDITLNEITAAHMGIYNIDASGSISNNDLTIVKVGVSAFGIIGTDPPNAVPQPFDDFLVDKGGSKALLTVVIDDNDVQFSGPDNTATFGIEVDAGWGPNDLSATGTGNSVSGFEVGFEIYKCETSCNTGVFTSVAFNYNDIVGNTIGMRSNVDYLTVDGRYNWWGHASGPSGVAYGYGDAVSDYVDYCPWLDGPYLTGAVTANVLNTTLNTVHCSIQDAIDNATPTGGDVITVAPGVYYEDLDVDKGVTLLGANAGTPCWGMLTVASKIAGSGGTAILINADGVTIDGFSITNPAGNFAISASGRNNLSVENNLIYQVGTLPVLSGNTHAVAIVMGTTANITNINISENCFSDIKGGENPALSGAEQKNSNGSASAIAVGWSNAAFDIINLNIQNNFISNVNACTNEWIEGGKGAYGVIINVGASGSYAGKAVSPVVHYNTISDLEGLWAHGIGLEGETPGAVVNNNEVFDLTDYKTPSDAIGILIEDNDGAASVGLHDNSLTLMSYAIVNLMPGKVDATCNWYGAADPVSVSAKVLGNLNVNPYLTSGLNNIFPLGNPGFIPTGLSCNGYYPVHNVTQDLYYITIQAAEDEANPNNFIEAVSGIYPEQVHVDVEGLTITGVGATKPIIKSPALLNVSFSTKKAVVCAHTVNSLSLVNFVIDGDGQGIANNSFLGLAFWNSGGTVLDVDVTGVIDNPFSGTQHGVAVYSYNDTGDPYTLKIDNMEVTDFQKTALALSGDGMTVDLDNIDITGAGATAVTAQNGIQIGFGAGGTVDLCTVDGMAYTGASWTASGILLYQGASVDVTDVDITNCQTSVVFQDTDGSLNGGSTISSPLGDGVYVYASNAKSASESLKDNLSVSVFEESGFKGGSKATVNVSIDNCIITGTGAIDSWGVGPYGSGTVTASITNTYVTGWDYGIVTYDLGGATINCTATDNDLSNNTTYGFYSNTTNVQTATCNWWGSFCGNIIATLVAGPVNYTPWLIGGTDGAGAGFQPLDPCTGVFPELTSVSMQASKLAVGPPWDYLVSGDLGSGYSMCITPDIGSFFLDINALTSSPAMKTGLLNPFTLITTSLPTGWFPYWAVKDVTAAYALANPTSWQAQMWLIINGNAPFFYIKNSTTNPSGYILVDGLQYWLYGGEPILELPGDYPNHNYTYTGNFTDVDDCVSLPIDVTMDFHTCDISGILAYNNTAQTGLNAMTVTLNSTPPVSSPTGTDGSYTLSNVQSGTHTISFNDNGLTAGGINATDAAQVNHYGVAPWSIEKVRFFAGDVSGENIVSAFDAQQILAYFVNAGNVPYNFTPIWKFWLAGDMINAISYAGPANPSVTVLSTSMTQGLYGLSTGDFNQSFVPGLTKSASETLTLEQGKNFFAGVGTEIELPIVAGMDMDLGAASLILNFPSDKLEITGVFLTSDPTSPLLHNVVGDELRIGWSSLIPVYLNEGESLISLKVKVIGEAEEGMTLSLMADPLNELADADFDVLNDAVLVVDVIHTSALGMFENLYTDNLELANHPNPFNESTTFTYTIPTNGKVTLEIYDILGNKVKVLVEEMEEAGSHQIILNSGALKPGVYMANLQLDTQDNTSQKTIRIINR